MEIAEASLAQQEEILRQTDVAFKVGDKSEFEQLQARVSRDNQLPLVLQNRSRRQEAYLRLKQLLNVPLDDEVRLTTALEELPARFATPSDLAADARAPVRQAEEEVHGQPESCSPAPRPSGGPRSRSARATARWPTPPASPAGPTATSGRTGR